MKRSDFSPDPRVALKEMEAHLKAGFAHKRAIVDSELPIEEMFTALLEPDPKPSWPTAESWAVCPRCDGIQTHFLKGVHGAMLHKCVLCNIEFYG